MSKRRPFPYEARAERCRRAQKVLDDAWRHPLFEGREAAVDVFWAAMEDVLPDGFYSALRGVKAGDPTGSDAVIEFLEADPYFFRSGYLKADAAKYLKRLALGEAQRNRLRRVVLGVVSAGDRREFRHYCHLAKVLDSPSFRDQLHTLSVSTDAGVSRRARWVLSAFD